MNTSIENMIGETLTYVDECGDEILLTCASGRKFILYHNQNCCETVSIQDRKGEWHQLYGKKLTLVSQEESFPEDGKDYDSATLTTFVFRADDETVISRWIGESNGYYSESVDIEELK